MTTLTAPFPFSRLDRPRPMWRRVLDWLAAIDALHRERANLRRIDDRTLRDIGATRADVERTLSRPAGHARLILLRGGDQLQH